MLKPFSLLFFIAVFAWLGAILITSNPTERMDRACSPVTLVDKVVVASALLLNEQWGTPTKQAMQSWHYGCRFIVWKVFYEQDWQASTETERQRHIEQVNQLSAPPSPPAPDAPSPATPVYYKDAATTQPVRKAEGAK